MTRCGRRRAPERVTPQGDLATGASNAELAGRLFISEETVRTHVKRVLHQLGLRDRAQAIVYAYESGLVAPGSGRG